MSLNSKFYSESPLLSFVLKYIKTIVFIVCDGLKLIGQSPSRVDQMDLGFFGVQYVVLCLYYEY